MTETRQDQIQIPAHIEEMRIKHLDFIMMLREIEDREPTIGEIARMNAAFTGTPIKRMSRYLPKDNQNLFYQIVQACATYEPKPIPLEIEFTYHDKETDQDITQKYTFRDDFTKLPTDWFIDVDSADFEENPILLAAFCYIEEGMTYGEEDEHGNIINMLRNRCEIFTEHMPLSLYMDLQTFFLLKWNVLRGLLIKRNRDQREKQNRGSATSSNGKKQ